MNKKVKAFSIALACGLVFSILMSFARFGSICDGIRDNVIRIHILANSDSTADQLLKMQIRDRIVAEAEGMFNGCKTKQEAMNCLEDNLEELKIIAQNETAARGYNLPIELKIKKAQFETREYENFTLPAGEYDALCISIGEAKGQNWWCVMFPTLCIGAAEAEENFSKSQTQVVEGREKYRIRFKAVEIFQDIRNILNF